MKAKLYIYRYDIIGILFVLAGIHGLMWFVHEPGMVVFSDIDFPFNSERYLNQIYGVWNHRFNTTALLNTPRLLSILPSYLISMVFGYDGAVFFKVFLFQNLYLAAFSFYLFTKRLLRIYYNPNFSWFRIMLLALGSLYYALNPWVMFRIQHIYLLVGYSLFPFVLLEFFKLFDHKFQGVVIKDYDYTRLYTRNVKDAILLALAVSVSAGAIHYFFYTILLFAGLLLLIVVKYSLKYIKEGRTQVLRIYKVFALKSIILVLLVLLFSAYWFLPYVGSIVLDVAATQNNVNVLDTYTAFSRHSDVVSVLYMVSYWWPMVSLDFLDIKFFVGGAFILGAAAIGFAVSIKKNHVVLFLGLLGIILTIFSTGVYYLPVAKWFLVLVELPIIGSMFRDPNKLSGLLVLCIGVAFVFGMDVMYSRLSKIGNYNMIGIVFVLVFTGSTSIYLVSMQSGYSQFFYHSIKEPDAYKEINEYLVENNEYSIFLPMADEMLQQSRVTTPEWNQRRLGNEESVSTDRVQKATGDVHIYNTSANTLFQYEGNDPSVGYYLHYLHYLLDENKTNSYDQYLELLGSNRLIYHMEYMEQEERQKEHLHILEQNDEMKIAYTNAIFTVFETDKDLTNISNQIIYSDKGYEGFELYQTIEGYDPLRQPTVFAYQELGNLKVLEESIQGYIDFSDREAMIMQGVPDEDFIYPFNWIKEGNPYLKWSKTYASSKDWQWYLDTLNYPNRSFDFDYFGGLAVAFTYKALDALPYEKKHIEGRKVMDFDGMLAEDIFFEPDNRDLFEVQGNPYNRGNDIQIIHGELIKGEPKDIWQVAKSGYMEAEEGMPYQFDLLMSGRFIRGLHFKVRFYDEDKEEIGISYVVAPDEVVSFDTVNFYGEVISPKNSRWMRLDLLTFQKPEVKSYWWIHDVNIYALENYVSSNTIGGKHKIQDNDLGKEHDVYVRIFESDKGGTSTLTIGEKIFTIDSRSTHNGFTWRKLGNIVLNQSEIDLEVTSEGGFNVLNCLVITSRDKFEQAMQNQSQILNTHALLVTKELSLELGGYGQLQTLRTNSSYSYGKGVELGSASAQMVVDVLKEGNYEIYHGMDFPLNQGQVILSISKENEEIHSLAFSPDGDHKHKVWLDEGTYTFRYQVESMAKNYALLEHIKPFEPGNMNIQEFFEDPYMSDCSECESITMEMMGHDISNEILEITYDPTCSCDWYIYSTPYIEAETGDEWLVEYEAKSNQVQKRHGKVIYVDEKREPIAYTFISEVEEQDKIYWQSYQQIFEVPEGAKGMYLQFWTRGNKKERGSLSIKNLLLNRYRDYISLDHMVLMEKHLDNEAYGFAPKMAFNEGSVIYESTGVDGMINTFMSPNKYFANEDEGHQLIKLNGVTAGYKNRPGEPLVIKALLYQVYLGGMVVFIITLASSIIYFVRKRA